MISVKHELPPKGKPVLVYDANTGTFDVAYYAVFNAAEIWLSKNGSWAVIVTHWQHLPEMPRIVKNVD